MGEDSDMEGGSGNDTRASTPTTPKAQLGSQVPNAQPLAGYPQVRLLLDSIAVCTQTRNLRTVLIQEATPTIILAPLLDTAIQSLKAHPPCTVQGITPLLLKATEEMLQQVIKGYQETNVILREGLRAHSGQAAPPVKPENQGEQMDVDPTRTLPVLPLDVKRAPVSRSKASKAVARIVRDYFNDTFKGNEEDRAAVRGYKSSEGPPCTIDNFKLDLQGPPCGPWNKHAKKVFLKGLLETKAHELSNYKPSTKVLENLFVSNFKNARAKLKWQLMSEPQQELTKQAHRRTERKRWLYFCRLQAAERFKDTRCHAPMIAAYGWEGMSTDDSDHDNGSGEPDYGVLKKKWRHPDVSACLKTLDCLHRDSRFKKNRRVTAGAHPHRRSLCSKFSTSPPVPRLPSGLYDPAWLARQPDIMKEDLEITESAAYDFSHTAAIQDLSRVNNGKKDSIYPSA
ncbi:hypothetical protein H1R20_g9793, partial [Candolleomyces eurysporus]